MLKDQISMLSDPVIRAALLDKLNRGRPQPKALIEELRIHNGNAIADIVAVYNEAHCYEIKGENDKIERIIEQGRYYDRAFRKVTLVTTSRHIRKAVAIAPEHWGILEAKRNNVGKVTFNADVPGSSPGVATIFFKGLAQANPFSFACGDYKVTTACLPLHLYS